MRRLARLSLATMGLALALPVAARADVDLPVPASGVDETVTRTVVVPVPPHKHTGKLKLKPRLCEKCAAAKPAPVIATANSTPLNMEGAKIVSCSHNPNSVCKDCQALLAMPGAMMVAGPSNPAPPVRVASDAAPGRAVVSGNEPEPIDVMRTNYAANVTPVGQPAPGRAAVKSASSGRAPFLSPSPESSPHILGHLFGVSEMRNDFKDWRGARGRQKRDAHAAVRYGPEASRVEELPASMVFGKGPR